MRFNPAFLVATLIASGLLFTTSTHADDLTITRTALAVQTITVPDGSPLSLLLPPELELVGEGPLAFTFPDNPFGELVVDADFFGTEPFPFLLEGIDFPAVMVKDGSRYELMSVTPFELNTILPIGPGGALVALRVFTIEDAIFFGDVPGVGFPPGTLFTSPEFVPLGLEVDGFPIVDEDGNPIPVAFSSDRTVVITGP